MAKEKLSKNESTLNINPESVQTVVNDLGDNPKTYFKTLFDKRIKDTGFAEIVHPEFQVFRIGYLGFELPINPEDKAKHGIILESISSFGPETAENGWDSIESINTMRAFVASAFFEEASREKLPTPVFNNKLIDPPPAKKHQIATAAASKPGMFLYDWEELESKWAKENPEFYQETIKLKDKLSAYYTSRLTAAYKDDLPEEYLEQATTKIKQSYEDYLMEYAIRTYAMFIPTPPLLIEIKKIVKKDKDEN